MLDLPNSPTVHADEVLNQVQHELARNRPLTGMVVVITGAARGIGRAIAREFGTAGASIVVDYAHSQAAAEQLVGDLLEQGAVDALAVQADVAEPDQAAALIDQTIARFGRIDVLVNNAGITADHSMKKMTVEEWDRVVRVDLSSCFYTVKAALPYFVQQQSGAIINISSFVGQEGNFGQANYSAAKAGILGFTKTAALEFARYHVTVNAVCPGFIETDMYAHIPEQARAAIVQRIPLGRIGQAEEVAHCVRYLVEHGQYITGQAISINGGIYM